MRTDDLCSFDTHTHCEEHITVTPEEEAEVNRLIAEENQALAEMQCYLCRQPIQPQQQVEHHHPIYKSHGGTITAPTHKACHRDYHRKQGDYRDWGRQSSLTRRWAFNLRNVNMHPAYSLERKFYLTYYAK